MRQRLVCGILLWALANPMFAQPDFKPNYDEAQVGTYTLPDPLKDKNGQPVRRVKDWEQNRRQWVDLFADHVYGRTPPQRVKLRFQTMNVDENARSGRAVRKQIAIFFADYPQLPPIDVLLYIPKAAAGKAPVFVGLNFCGNHCVTAEADVPLTTRWVSNVIGDVAVNNRATEKGRGVQARRWPIDTLLARGYAVATAYYGDIEPDHPQGWKTGIRSVLGDSTKSNNWGAIGAWAWGMSRMLDYLETEPTIDAKQAIAIGHSRLGKAALWAAAQDTRFAAVISNESGEGGAALSRRNFGETVGRINHSFPHWFTAKYKEYNQKVADLPVDQHILLGLIAPRPLYVAAAEDDRWADTKGQFLSAHEAGKVYALYGKSGLGVTEVPAVNQSVGKAVRFHVRTGVHDVTDFDWWQYLKFADEELRP